MSVFIIMTMADIHMLKFRVSFDTIAVLFKSNSAQVNMFVCAFTPPIFNTIYFFVLTFLSFFEKIYLFIFCKYYLISFKSNENKYIS